MEKEANLEESGQPLKNPQDKQADGAGGDTVNIRLRLNIKRTVLVGLAFFTVTMFWQVYDSLMPLFLKNFDFNKLQTGLVMALDNVLGLVLLPFMGLLSDRFPQKFRNKFGRRIPFIVIGSALAACAFLLVNFAHNERMLALLLVSTAFLLVFMCLYRTPAVALMPDVTPKQIRSQANTVINIMGTVGGVIALLLMQFFLKTEGEWEDKVLIGDSWIVVGIICALMLSASVIMVIKVKENKFVEQKMQLLKDLHLDQDEDAAPLSDEKTSLKQALASLPRPQLKSLLFLLLSVFLWYMAYNAVTTHFSRYAYEALNIDFAIPLLIANASAFAMFVPASLLGKKMGRKRTVLLGVAIMAVAFGIAAVIVLSGNVTAIRWGMYPVFVLVGAGWATINVHSFVMSVEFATEKTTGVFTGLYYTFVMSAQVLTPVIAGALLDALGFSILMPYAALFTVLAFLSMLLVRHGNAKDKPIV